MTQALWTAEEVASTLEVKLSGSWHASSVSIDSRNIHPGGLFIAIVGERVNGHQFVAQAFENGAVAAIVSQPVPGVPPEKLVMVDDTFEALEALGEQARKRTCARIIGITGSVGKTTTKECVRLMCEAFGPTHASKGNLNNHYGAPLSLANMPAHTEFGVFEMGMNHAGEIASLTRMIRPHVAVITTVESVHLEFFKSEQAIASAKAEIFEGLEEGGRAVLNADNTHTPWLLELLKRRAPTASVISFGQERGADMRQTGSACYKDGCRLMVQHAGQHYEVPIAASGRAVLTAALVTMACAAALSLDLEKAAISMRLFEGVQGRGMVQHVNLQGKSLWWIDDSYNASPASMRAAFEKLALVKQQKQATRAVAVLGDMLELGEQSIQLHSELAGDMIRFLFDAVYTTGEQMQHLHQALKGKIPAIHCPTLDDLKQRLKEQLHSGDVVLFKGSHGSQIHRLVKELQTTETS